ncbi:hypothetical protein ACFX2F_018150 [Malus domestica]
MEIPEEKKVKLVTYKLKSGPFALWEQLQISQTRQRKTHMHSWMKMKPLLKARFLPPDYEQVLFQQYQECKQRSRTVQAYTKEFYRLASRNDLMETEAQQTTIYIGGLRLAIQDRVCMQSVFTVVEAVNLATKVEAQMDRSKNQANRSFTFDSL